MTWDKTKDELREESARTMNKKKNTAKWCRGKVGVEHVTETVINHNYTSTKGCNWYPVYYSFKRRAEGPKDWRYWCKHSIKCTNCGKYTEIFLGVEQCPDASPRPE